MPSINIKSQYTNATTLQWSNEYHITTYHKLYIHKIDLNRNFFSQKQTNKTFTYIGKACFTIENIENAHMP